MDRLNVSPQLAHVRLGVKAFDSQFQVRIEWRFTMAVSGIIIHYDFSSCGKVKKNLGAKREPPRFQNPPIEVDMTNSYLTLELETHEQHQGYNNGAPVLGFN